MYHRFATWPIAGAYLSGHGCRSTSTTDDMESTVLCADAHSGPVRAAGTVGTVGTAYVQGIHTTGRRGRGARAGRAVSRQQRRSCTPSDRQRRPADGIGHPITTIRAVIYISAASGSLPARHTPNWRARLVLCPFNLRDSGTSHRGRKVTRSSCKRSEYAIAMCVHLLGVKCSIGSQLPRAATIASQAIRL